MSAPSATRAASTAGPSVRERVTLRTTGDMNCTMEIREAGIPSTFPMKPRRSTGIPMSQAQDMGSRLTNLTGEVA